MMWSMYCCLIWNCTIAKSANIRLCVLGPCVLYIVVGCCPATKVFTGNKRPLGDHRVGNDERGSWANKIVIGP